MDYWHIYYDPDIIARAESVREEHQIESTGVTIHMDVYPGGDGPLLIFNHGGGGYSKIFVLLALALHEQGYTVILPDQHGQGYSGGKRGDFTLGQCVQNAIDVADWARQRFDSPLVMGGGSVGSAVAYGAAALVDAVICHNLYDFGKPEDALAVSRFAPLGFLSGVSHHLIHAASMVLPSLHLPFGLLGRFEHMVDDPQFYPRWRRDPYPLRRVSLRYLHSMSSTPFAVPLEANRLPVLVINPVCDRMVSPEVTRRNYERLGGPKTYVEIDYGHWATNEDFIREWTDIVDQWLATVLVPEDSHHQSDQLDRTAPSLR